MLETLGTPNSSLRPQEVDMLRDLVSRRLSRFCLLGDPWAQDPGGQPALTCLGIWSLEGCHTSTFLRICQSRDPRRLTCLDLSRDPILGRPTCLNLPKESISRRLWNLNLPRNLHPDSGMPGSQVAIVLDRISFRNTHPKEVHPWK